MAFDPNEYLAATAPQQPQGAPFDPAAYLAQSAAPGAPQPDVGLLEALLRGGAQGATLGFADELAGGTEALSDVAFKGDKHLSDLLDLYRQHRGESRVRHDAAESQHPYASLLGNLAGAAAPALLTAGMSAPGAAGAAALRAGVGEAGALASAESAANAATWLTRAAEAAKTGATIGAVGGVGTSKSDLTKGEVVGTAEDAALGAALGAGTGALTSVAVDTAKPVLSRAKESVFDPIYEKLRDTGYVGKALQAGEYGYKDGFNLVGKKNFQKFVDDTNEAMNLLPQQLRDRLHATGKQYDELFAKGEKVDISPWMKQLEEAKAYLAANNKGDATQKAIQEIQSLQDNWVKGVEKTVHVPEMEAPGLDKVTRQLDVLEGNHQADLLENAAGPRYRYATREIPENGRTGEAVVDTKTGQLAEGPAYMKAAEEGDQALNAMAADTGAGEAAQIPQLHDRAPILNAFEQELNAKYPEGVRRYTLKPIAGEDKTNQLLFDKNGDPRFYAIYDMLSENGPKKVGPAIPYEEMIQKEKLVPVTQREGGVGTTPTLGQSVGMQRELAGYTSAGDSPLKSDSARQMANAAVYGGDSEFSKFFPGGGLKGLNETASPQLAKINQTYSALTQAEKSVPDLNHILHAEGHTDSTFAARDKISEFLGNLEKADPEMAQQISPDLTALAEKRDIFRDYHSKGLEHGLTHFLVGSVKGATLGGANRVGLIANQLFKATPEKLRTLSAQIAMGGGKEGQALANILNQVAERDPVGRNALLFSISQNPGYRHLLHSLTGTDEKKP